MIIFISPFLIALLVIATTWHLIRGHGQERGEDNEEQDRDDHAAGQQQPEQQEQKRKPLIVRREIKALKSVNYHFTRKCNYECGFCFHTAKTSFVLPIEKMKIGLRILAENGMKKLNLSGGEPFLYPHIVGPIIQYCKEELHLESVSIVSNGSKIKEKFFIQYGKYLDILAVSVDSFDENTNRFIGRGFGNHLPQTKLVAGWCRKYNVMFKINTVVNKYNWEEDMNEQIAELAPFRWKCFQVLLVDTENAGPDAIRNAETFLIENWKFDAFISRHSGQTCLVQEPNNIMKSSYIILDEYMHFLNKGDEYGESKSILDPEVTLDEAMAGIDFDQEAFDERDGDYDWTNPAAVGSCGTTCGGGDVPQW